MATEPALYSVADTARILSIGRTKTYSLIDEGLLATISIGTRRLVKAESIKRLVEGVAMNEGA